MPLLRAVPVLLSAGERTTLTKRVRRAKTAHRDRLRAQIVLAAARGHPNARIAVGLGVSAGTVRKWRGRFADRGLDGLADRPRPGRPRRISAADRAAVVALACQLPAGTGVPLARWTGPELTAELAARELASPMSPSSVRRILAGHPVRPWRYQSWIYPRDPDFEARAKVIVDLYQGFYQGKPLRAGDRVLSFDAKPQINARRRLHPALPAAPGRPVRYEHEYRRQGSLALLAGLDVHTGQVFASTPLTTGIKPFMDLAGQVLGRLEYKDAPRVFVIVDNGSDHRGQAAATRLAAAHPNAIMIHTPVHASWLNQIEIFFSVIQKKVVTPNDFDSLDQLSSTLLAFVDRYNRTARAFSWKFTASDLHDLMTRISRHEHQQPSRSTATAGRVTPPTNFRGQLLMPVNCKDIIQLGMCGDALSDFLEHDSGRPAFFVNQQVAKHIQPFCPGEMAQAHGINYPDLADRSRLLGHGSTSAPVPAGRSDSVICPCRSSTALAAVSAPFLHAAMTASA
jgi:transposase